jgi:hypothetical protein
MNSATHWPLGSRVPTEDELNLDSESTKRSLTAKRLQEPSKLSSTTYDRLGKAMTPDKANETPRLSKPIEWLE